MNRGEKSVVFGGRLALCEIEPQDAGGIGVLKETEGQEAESQGRAILGWASLWANRFHLVFEDDFFEGRRVRG